MTTNKLKRPCAVELDGLNKKQAIELQELFLKDGAQLVDDIYYIKLSSWNYFGLDWEGSTQVYHTPSSFSEDDNGGNVTIYIYDEVVSLMSCNDDAAITDLQATKVLPEGDNSSESNTDRFKLIGKYVKTSTMPNVWAIVERYDSETGGYEIIYPDNNSDGYVVPKDSFIEIVDTLPNTFKVICNKTYTITIKGQEFVLTEAEYVELEEAMRLVDE